MPRFQPQPSLLASVFASYTSGLVSFLVVKFSVNSGADAVASVVETIASFAIFTV